MADPVEDLLSEGLRDTDAEILENAFKDEPVKTEPEKAEPETPEPKEQPRDETGKFTAKEAEPEPKPDEQPVEDKDGQVPSWRLREVAEARRAAEAKADAEAKRNATLELQLRQLSDRLAGLEKPKEQTKQEEIDPLIDPQGFAKRIESSFNQRLTEIQLNNNLALAHVRHGEKFEKAYEALLQSAQTGNRQLVSQLTSQPNPGEAIVKWYSDQETLREVGGDPASYKQKLLDEALKNPEFLAKAIEAAKVSAGGQSKPNNVTQLPPSLSRVAGSAATEAVNGEISVEALLGR